MRGTFGYCRLLLEGLGDREAVLIDVMPGDQAVLHGEVQGETGTVGAAGRAGCLANFAQYHRIRAVGQDLLDSCADFLRDMMVGDPAVVIGGVGGGRTMADPWRRGSAPRSSCR